MGHRTNVFALDQKVGQRNAAPNSGSLAMLAGWLGAGHGSPDSFDDLAVAFNDQFRGVTFVKHPEAGF